MTSPISRLLVLLLLMLPPIGLLGRAIANIVECERRVRDVLAPAFSLATWLLTVHIIARQTQSFSVGLVVGTSLVACAGLVAFVFDRKKAHNISFGVRSSRWMWVGAVCAAAILAPTALGWHLHDELNPTGHMSIAAQMLNDVYPPRHNTFPQTELNYHYAFDLLVAAISAMTRQRVDHVIDGITVLFWGWSFCLAWVIGERVMKARGVIVATNMLFAGGFLWLCAQGHAATPHDFVGHCEIGGHWPNPPVASYFFQHPWTMGIPIALALVLLLQQRPGRPAFRLAAVGLLLVLLSISQFALFLSLAPSIVVQEFFSEKPHSGQFLDRLVGARFSPQRGVALLMTTLVALFLASRIGGFFAQSTDRLGPTLLFQVGVTERANTTLHWMIASFGVVLPLGFIGLSFVRSIRLLAFCVMLGSLIVINTFRLKETWDIVKFGTAGMLFLGMFAGVTLDRLVSWDKRYLSWPLAALLFGSATASGVLYFYFFGTKSATLQSFFPPSVAPLPADDSNVASYLRAHAKPGELVYRARAMSRPYAYWAGLPQVWTEKHAKTFGFSLARIQRRDQLFVKLPPTREPYLAENVRWFVLDSKYDATLISHTNAWLTKHQATEVMTSGSLRLIHLD